MCTISEIFQETKSINVLERYKFMETLIKTAIKYTKMSLNC